MGHDLEMTSPRPTWKVQVAFPRDYFDEATLTIEQWLANGDARQKWRTLIEVSALAAPHIASDGLREAPRVGFDPVGDQTYFLFKLENNGTTVFVSSDGIAFA